MHATLTEPVEEPRGWPFIQAAWLQAALLIIVGVLAYANSFDVPFLFDDETSIVTNEYIRDLYGFLRDGYTYNPNRFIGYLSFAVNYAFGGLKVGGYHAVNLVIHLANALLVCGLVRLLLRTPLVAGENYSCHESRLFSLIPFFVALLFVCHPLQTQAVTYIVQRLTSLATLFYLASLVLYLRYRLTYEAGYPVLTLRVMMPLLLSSACAVLAMKTKEIAVTLPVMVLLAEFALFGRPDWKRMALLAPLVLTVLIIPLTMLNLSKPAGELLSDVSAMTSDTTTIGRGAYLITQFHVIVRYLQLLVLPYGQNLDHTIPLSTSLLEPLPLLSLLLLLGVLAGAVVLWRRGEPGTQTPMAGLCRLAAFGIFWFFIALSVESSIVPIRDLMFEHRVYLPSVGFFLSVVSLVGLATGRFGRKLPWLWTGAPFGLAVVALLSVGTTVARNRVWLDGITLWSDVRDKSPGKYRAYSMLGTYYVEEGRTQEALAVLETAVRLNPKAYDSLFNLAQVYGWLGRNQEAEEVLATLKREAPERFREFETVYRSQFAFPGTAR